MATTDSIEGLRKQLGSAAVIDLDRLYRQQGETVSRWIHRLWGSRDAEDVLHEVFMVVQRRSPDFRGDSSITTWLYSITVRVVSDRRRKERWRRLLFARAEPQLRGERGPVETPLGSALREQAVFIVYAVLDRLSERDRTLLILFEIEGLPIASIGEILRMSQENVCVSLHRARARFRKAHSKRYGRTSGVEDADQK
jgi:RNA polymerase sigma-70 factor (ECF subfamily)